MIGIIGGTGVYNIAEKADNEEKIKVKTNYNANPEVSLLEIEGKEVAFYQDTHQDMHILHI